MTQAAPSFSTLHFCDCVRGGHEWICGLDWAECAKERHDLNRRCPDAGPANRLEDEQLERAYRYCEALRNKPKKLYASAYLEWVLAGRKGDSPTHVVACPSFTRQAVRIRLDEILGGGFFP